MLTAAHEAAHVVAGYLQGRRIDVVTAHGSSPRTESGRTFSDISSREDAEDEITILLAGSAAIEELGIRSVGGGRDDRLAGELAIHVTSTVEKRLRCSTGLATGRAASSRRSGSRTSRLHPPSSSPRFPR